MKRTLSKPMTSNPFAAPALVECSYDVLDQDLCRALMALFATGHACGISSRIDADFRRCTQLAFPHPEMPCAKVLMDRFVEAIRPAIERYKASLGSTPLGFCNAIEQPSIILYEPNKEQPEEFKTHADVWCMESATRQLSIIAYLNDVEEGGETVFTNLGHTFPARAGSLLLFPSFFTHTHSALPPISSNKYCVVTWLHFAQAHYRTYPF